MRNPEPHGALWALLGVAALAAGAAMGRRGGRALRPVEEGPLRFRASGTVRRVCEGGYQDDGEEFEVDWEPGDPLPDEEDMWEIAQEHFLRRADYADFNMDCDIQVSDLDVEPRWRLVPTLRGKPRIYHE